MGSRGVRPLVRLLTTCVAALAVFVASSACFLAPAELNGAGTKTAVAGTMPATGTGSGTKETGNVGAQREADRIAALKSALPSTAARGFVARDKNGFRTADRSPFRFIGANTYNAAGDPAVFECGPYMGDPDTELDDWFTRVKRDFGGNVVRFWAYQSYTKGGEDWRALDRVMRLANNHQMKVIPVLENQWDECTRGGYKQNSWYAGGYLEPYGGYKLSYREYVRRIVSRYKEERAILGWMLMNEAESMTPKHVADPEALFSFTRNVSSFIKSIDGNHLVTLGVIGGSQPGVADDGYERLHSLDTIDFLDLHDYDPEHVPMPTDVARDLVVSKKIGKPLVVGESGITVTDLKNGNRVESVPTRAEKFDAKIRAFLAAGGDGYLVWAWHPVENSSYDFTTGDPLNQVLKRHAESLSTR